MRLGAGDGVNGRVTAEVLGSFVFFFVKLNRDHNI